MVWHGTCNYECVTKSNKNMEYIKVLWPDSQALMSLTDEDMEEYGIELGDDCSYFVPEEDYDEIMELAEERVAEEMAS